MPATASPSIARAPARNVARARKSWPTAPSQGEWAAFIADGGYREPRWWLADGWAWVKAEAIEAPLYWQQGAEGWTSSGWTVAVRSIPPRP